MESKWQQVSLSLQDSSQHSGYSLDGPYSSSYFQVIYNCINPMVTVPR